MAIGSRYLDGPNGREFALVSRDVDGVPALVAEERILGPRLRCAENGKTYRMHVTADGNVSLEEIAVAGAEEMVVVNQNGGRNLVRVILVGGEPVLEVT